MPSPVTLHSTTTGARAVQLAETVQMQNIIAHPRSTSSNSGDPGGLGTCLMSSSWRDEQGAAVIKFVSSFLTANSFRLDLVDIGPDFIFNCGGESVAFMFVTAWDSNNDSTIFSRVRKLKEKFPRFTVVVTLPNEEKNESFVRSYFRSGMEIGRPTFVPVRDIEMGFEKIVQIAVKLGECKKQDTVSKLKMERQLIQRMDIFVAILTSIPGIVAHDANMLNQGIGSIEAIAKATKQHIMDNTDLSEDKAETITRFFRDPKMYLAPNFN